MAALKGDVPHIPVIDLTNSTADLGDLLVESISRWGFVFIRSLGSGFTPGAIDRIFELVRLMLRS